MTEVLANIQDTWGFCDLHREWLGGEKSGLATMKSNVESDRARLLEISQAKQLQ